MTRLAIDFKLDPSLELDPKLVKQKNGKLLIDVDGELEITLNGCRFFWEPSFTLLELGVSLQRWRLKDPEANKDFHFFTMEHDEREGPILSFTKKNGGQWQLFSIWQEFEQEDAIPTNDLLEAVDRYLKSLEALLIERFNLRYRNFMKR